MALADIRPFAWPGYASRLGNSVGFATQITLDAVGEYDSLLLGAEEAMAASHLVVRTGATTVTAPTLKIGLYTVDSNGNPTTTPFATNSEFTTGALALNGTGVTVGPTAMGGAASIAAGARFHFKVELASGGPVIINRLNSPHGNVQGFPVSVGNIGTPTQAGNMARPWGIGSSATALYPMRGLYFCESATTIAFLNTDAAVKGMRFVAPFSGRITGLVTFRATNTGDFNYGILDSAGNELSSSYTSFTGTHGLLTAAPLSLPLDNYVNVVQGQTYIAAIKAMSAVTATGVAVHTMSNAAYRSGWPHDTACDYAEFTTSGGWTFTNTTLPAIDVLIIPELGGGGGGGSIFSGGILQ